MEEARYGKFAKNMESEITYVTRLDSRGEKCSSGILWLLRPAGQKYRIRDSPKESSANAASCNRERSNPESREIPFRMVCTPTMFGMMTSAGASLVRSRPS